jgi:nitroreductase
VDIQQAIQTKRAVREFAERPLPEEAVLVILNAGRRSQSSKNTQPWWFLAIRDRQRLKALAELGTYASHLATAALGVAILTPDPAQRFSILFDAGQAAAYMQLAAWGLGIGSCLVTLHNPEPARALLGLPPEVHARMAISFGYPADPGLIERPPRAGGRKPFQDKVFFEYWQSDRATSPGAGS